MFKALAVGVFFVLLYWVRRLSRTAADQAQRLKLEQAESQHLLENAQHRTQQIVSLLTELHEHKVSRTGHVPWADLADFTVQTISPLAGVEKVVFLRWDARNSEFRGEAARGLSPQQLSDLHVRFGEGILGRAAQGGVVVVAQESPAVPIALPQERFLTVPYLILPLLVRSQVTGLLVLFQPQEKRIGPQHLRMATLMAKQLQLTMENLDLYETRQRVFGEGVEMLALALDAKEHGSHNHREHCRSLVRAMAREMRLPERLVEQIEYGAVLHDVGKIGIRESILLKTGPLTDEEYVEVKRHPEIGYQIVSGVSFLKGVAPIVRYHHEWYNGEGYPEGLAGEEIPLGARMLAIADAWDAMTTDQAYHKAQPKNSAIADLRQQAGTQFDPKLVDVFLHVIDQMERADTRVPSPLVGEV